VLCAGDDRTDESMFTLNTPGLLSVNVGGGPTQAEYRVADPAQFREFLVKALVPK
jgi:trehalose 6-phosphate phosphatase